MLALINIVIILLNNDFFVESVIKQSLNHNAWSVMGNDILNNDKTMKTNIPNGIYSILRDSGKLPEDILYRFNDVKYRWVGEKSWTYFIWFSVDPAIFNTSTQELVFHGIDGVAGVLLNGVRIDSVGNSFIRYRFDVTGRLMQVNHLTIAFSSPILFSKKLSISDPQPSLLSANYVSKWNGEENVNLLRRMQASFGSDYGPAFPSIGIWKDVELIGYQNDVIIRDITVSTIPVKDNWRVEINIYSDSRFGDEDILKGTFTIHFTLKNNKEIEFSKNPVSLTEFEKITFSVLIPKAYVDEWWPNGYGDQHLYKLTAIFSNQNSNHQKTIKIGFRTVKLERKNVDPTDPAQGTLFYFTVNQISIFAKGANFLPVHILLEYVSDKKSIEYLVRSAKLANMNMLRVNGAGIYQPDYFYELCDEYGILVWQDMMFNTYMYPEHEIFMSEVSEEVTQQIARLQYHPSVILWVGNADFEPALKNIIRKSKFGSKYESQMTKLIGDTIMKAVFNIDETRPYLKSTLVNNFNPYNGFNLNKYTYDDGYLSFRESMDSWLTDNYPIIRFATEYGIQSFPSLETLKKVATDEDLSSINSEFMEHRQHSLNGNEKILRQIEYHFGILRIIHVENLIYVSQIEQAWAIKLQTEWYRSWRSQVLENGKGRTMGTLYWHLNDVWQAPSWSSIEYGGKWKILHYYAKKFFSPILVCVHMNSTGKITVNLVSDLLEDTQAILKMEIFKWNNMEALSIYTEPVVLEMEKSSIYTNTNLENLFSDVPSCSSRECFLKVTLIGQGNYILSDNYLFPSYFKDLAGLQDAEIEVTVINCSLNACSLSVKTNAIALFVWLDIKDKTGYFSDNGFIMTEVEKNVTFYCENEIKVEEVETLITVKMLSRSRLENFS